MATSVALLEFSDVRGERWMPIAANTRVRRGAALGRNGAFVREWQTGDPFAGFAINDCDNTHTGAVNGSFDTADSIGVRVASEGFVKLDVAASDATSLDADVHVTGVTAFALSGGIVIGKSHRHEGGTKQRVFFQATSMRSI